MLPRFFPDLSLTGSVLVLWWIVLAVVVLLALGWLFVEFVLNGPDLSAHDDFEPERPHHRTEASPEHQRALQSLHDAAEPLRGKFGKAHLNALREMLKKGFEYPYLMDPEHGFVATPVDVDGIPGEWITGPGTDPERRLLFIHGGSFVAGHPAGYRVITAKLAQDTGMSVLAIDYRVMPENRRWALIEDCRTAYRWIWTHGPDGSGDASEVAICGDSAGGNLTLMLSHWSRDENLNRPVAVIAIAPSTDKTLSSPTIRQNIPTDPILGPAMTFFSKVPKRPRLFLTWLIFRIRPNSPVISPVFGDHADLPPTLIQVSEAECLLGEAKRYVSQAVEAGSPVRLQSWPGMLHVWHFFEPYLPEAKEAFAEIATFIEQARERSSVHEPEGETIREPLIVEPS